MNKIEKLELKHLCGYLPHGLKTNEGELAGTIKWIGWCGVFKSEHGERFVPLSGIKPILLPLSALTEPLPDGTVPIVELAKIASHESDWFYSVENNWAEKNICADTFYFFDFLVNDKHFSYGMCSEDECLVSDKHFNVFDVIEYLYSIHADIFGLITAGLAIDKRIVKTN